MSFAWMIAIPLGVLAAIYKNSIFDRTSTILASAGMSFPSFFLAIIAVFFAWERVSPVSPAALAIDAPQLF